MPLIAWIAVFVAALAVLVKSADFFTDGAEEVGVYLGMPAYVVGVTIVAIGTSLPELVSSVIAVNRGASEIVMGSVVGSNVTNIFMVLGVAAILGRRLRVTYEIIRIDLPLLVGSAFLLVMVAYDGSVTLAEALICLAGSIIYLLYGVNISRRRAHAHEEIGEEVEEELRITEGQLRPIVFLKLAGGAAALWLGADWTVRSVIELARLLALGPEVIAISAVALGTSLPELTVSVVASRRGNLEVAIGNVLGSSVFNSFAVVGTAGLLGALTVPATVLTFGLPVMVMATLLYFFMAQDKEITAWEGWLLLLFYVLFLGKLFGVV